MNNAEKEFIDFLKGSSDTPLSDEQEKIVLKLIKQLGENHSMRDFIDAAQQENELEALASNLKNKLKIEDGSKKLHMLTVGLFDGF